MIIPEMQSSGNKSRDMLTQFGGYNHNISCSESSFYDMRNMSPKNAPFLSPRERRGAVNLSFIDNENPKITVLGMLAKDHLAFVADTVFPAFTKDTYYTRSESEGEYTYSVLKHRPHDWGYVSGKYFDSEHEPLNCSTAPVFYYKGVAVNGVSLTGAGRRQLVSMGANIVIFPDGVMYNTMSGAVTILGESTGEGGAATYGTGNEIQLSLTDAEGEMNLVQINPTTNDTNTGHNTYIGDAKPTGRYNSDGELVMGVRNGEYWIDTSGEKSVLKAYSEATDNWSSVPTTYIKISHASLAANSGTEPRFKSGDAVTISGFSDTFAYLNTSNYVIKAGAEDGTGYIIVVGILGAATATESIGSDEARTICFSRPIPEMDFVVESKNRLWGCKYDSETNEIYACKLGDPTNWYCYAGIASDSYAVSLGSDGPFTGGIAYGDNVLFFKEGVIHKIYGSKPSNYQTTFDIARGIGSGSALSAVISDETLYYLSKSGVMAYSGGNPVEIGQALGDVRLKDGVGGMLNGRYYLCATDSKTGERALYLFDIASQAWYKEDVVDIDAMATVAENLYAAGENQLAVINGESYDGPLPLAGMENQVEWFCETGDIGLTTPDEKYYSFFQLRLEAPAGSEIHISVKYDADARWREKTVLKPSCKRVYNIPFVSPRCDHMRLRFHGKGDFTVYSVSKFKEGGGDIYRG